MNHSASLMAARNIGQHQSPCQTNQQNRQKQQCQLQLQTHQTFNGKSLIDKDNLKDEDFDKLVIDISKLVGNYDECNGQQQKSIHASRDEDSAGLCYDSSAIADDREFARSSCSNSPSRANVVCNRLIQPKRPMNAFMVWGRAIRREIHLRFSNIQNALLSKSLGRVWRSLDSAAKEPYVRRANLIKANHRRDYPDYRYQPRRLQEKEKTKTIDDGDSGPILDETKLNGSDSSQSIVPSTRAGCQSSAPSFYPTINGGYGAAHRRMEYNTGSRRPNSTEINSQGLVTPSQQYYVSNLACQDNNNHINIGYRNGIYPPSSAGSDGCSGGMSDDTHLKAQYYGDCQQQQHRGLSSCRQQQNPAAAVYSYPGPCQHQHQFAYNMQFHQHQQQQEQHTYQQFHLQAPIQQQCGGNNSEVARMNYVESCSLSAVNSGGLDIGNRLFTAPSTIETKGNGFSRSYETRN